MATFVQADLACFREVVQRLTGTSECTSDGNPKSPSTRKPSKGPKQQHISKLHHRRQRQRPDIEITTSSPFQPMIIIPSLYAWPSPRNYSSFPLTHFSLQPLSPHELSSPSSTRPNKRASPSTEMMMMNEAEEEKAVKERRFYLHPSPRSSKHGNAAEPELLTLFPLTSPRETMDRDQQVK